jgi:GNAT superfamily N-acetyltransferase
VSSPEPAEYDEKARSYASLWVFVAIIVAGFVIDLVLGGGLAHLLGWLIALVLVVGVNFVVVYAVRSEKSLRVTAEELRVGDEAIPRADVVAIAAGVDETDLPVLGWPMGRPRALKGLTVRLADGQDVVVPTRFPDRLQAALGIAAEAAPPGHAVRAAARSEFALLAEVDQRAEVIFRTAGYDLPDLPLDPAELERAAAVFVAGRPPVGFVQVEEVDGLAHIVELAVIPRWMRQGIGTALLERACEWARAHGYPAMTLTTYADVPWNAPYYARRGFVEITDYGPGIAEERKVEAERGLDAVGRRIVMRRELA